MKNQDVAFLRELLRARSGLALATGREYLVEARLLPVARSVGFASLDQLMMELRRQPDSSLAVAIVDAMATGETFFFRDRTPFEQFREKLLPGLMSARASTRRLRIWCAACSTGQEPYSLAMLLHENRQRLEGWNIEIVATDMVAAILERARQGVYTQFEVQRGLSIQQLLKYFTSSDEGWRINPELRRMVRFQQLNLLHDFTSLGRFDVVFCRNVLIYFEPDLKSDILARLAKALRSDGALSLGGPETLLGLTDAFEPHAYAAGFYRPVPADARTARPQADAVA